MNRRNTGSSKSKDVKTVEIVIFFDKFVTILLGFSMLLGEKVEIGFI